MYHPNYNSEQNIANEQMISNMIKVIESPTLSEKFDSEELDLMMSAIKLHLIANAKYMTNDKLLTSIEKNFKVK